MAEDRSIPVQRLAAWGLRGLAVLLGLGGLLASAAFWSLAHEVEGLAGWVRASLPSAIALQLLLVGAVAGWLLLLERRAAMIGALRVDDYPTISCVAACTRLLGELLATGMLCASLALAVLTLADAAPFAQLMLERLGPDGEGAVTASWVLNGLAALMWPMLGLFAAGLVLFGAYLVAEGLGLMLDYVRDIRRIRESLERGEGPGAP